MESQELYNKGQNQKLKRGINNSSADSSSYKWHIDVWGSASNQRQDSAGQR
jgi:hypothetical protein